MKQAQRTERCLARLQRLIPKPASRLVSRHTEKLGEEYVEIVLEFRICGAYLDSARDRIMVLATVEKLDSGDMELGPKMIRNLVSATINDELGWINGAKWDLSIDGNSMRRLLREDRKTDYRLAVIQPIKRGEMTEREVVEVISGLLGELRPELREVLAATGSLKVRDGIIRIERNGLPCPICLGHLSEEDIAAMYHRLRFMHMFDDDDDPRGM